MGQFQSRKTAEIRASAEKVHRFDGIEPGAFSSCYND
jgi:hypothetical protein